MLALIDRALVTSNTTGAKGKPSSLCVWGRETEYLN